MNIIKRCDISIAENKNLIDLSNSNGIGQERCDSELNSSIQSICRSITPKLIRSKQHIKMPSSPINFRPTLKKLQMKCPIEGPQASYLKYPELDSKS